VAGTVNRFAQDAALAHPGVLRWWHSRSSKQALRAHVLEPRTHGWWLALTETWQYRWCIGYFGVSTLRKKYRRTWLGALWIPLKPGYSVASKLLIFGGILGVSSGTTPYPVFFLFAQAGWYLFFETALWSCRSLEVARPVLKRIELPRLPVMLGALMIGLVESVVYAVFAMLGLLYYVIRAHVFYLHFTHRVVLLPVGIFFLTMLGLGVGLMLSVVGQRARDVRFALHFGMGFLMYMTPVLYPLSQVPNHWRPLAEGNPVTGAIEMTKDGLFSSHELTLSCAIVTIVATIVLWVPGLWLYHRRDVQARLAAA
jgi:lipopolysaccharide transport system permease protein